MDTSLEDTQAQIKDMKLKLQRKKVEIRRLKKVLQIVSNKSDSDEERTEDVVDTEDEDDEGEGEDEGEDEDDDDESDEEDDEDEEEFPKPVQSYEHEDIYLCIDPACGAEVSEGYCCSCRKKHQMIEDENMASTESQLEHPDRCIAPRGNTPLRFIEKVDTPLPALYESRAREYRSLLRRGATPEMCELFSLEFTYSNGIVARLTQDLFEEFAGPSMEDGDDWKIYLGRRLTLEKDDIDGFDFIEGILDEISVLPNIGNWVTEEEEANVWVTYPKHNGQVESQPRDRLDLVDISAENLVSPTQSNDYDLADDDSEQADVEMEDPTFITTSGISYLHVDRWYVASDEDEDMSGSDFGDAEDGEQFDELAGDDDRDDSTTMSDSDEAGSDFDSDEILSGDEGIVGTKFLVVAPPAQADHGDGTMV